MTATSLHPPAPGTIRYSPADLAALLGLDPPTREQAEVIAAPLEPGVVVAGAGSGKTATMAARVVWLVANGLAPADGVLGLTFTRKAAAELSSRVRSRLAKLRGLGLDDPLGAAGEPGEPVVSTYHSYAGRLVAEHAVREAREPAARLLSPAVAWQVAARVVSSYAGPMDDVGRGPSWVTDAVLALAGELAEHLREPAELRTELERWRTRASDGPARRSACAGKLRQTSATTLQLLPLVEAYAVAKADRLGLDYGDQVALAARLALRHPDVAEGERTRFPVVLLDEYQDTGHAQRELLRALYGNGHPVTAVGDPCQSIYGWRGASAGGLRRFPEHFTRNGRPGPVRHLTRSFRNAPRILDVANRLAAPLRQADPTVPVLRAVDGCDPGRVEVALLETQTAEADWVAGRIRTLLVGWGHDQAGAGEAPLSPGDVAVLCRKRSQFPQLRRALEAAGLPVEVVGLGGLLTVPEVLDVVSVLQVLVDTAANAALLRLLTGPRLRLGARDLVALRSRAQELLGSRGRGNREASADSTPTGPAAALAGVDSDADRVSLIEAVDDLGPASRYSPVGYARLRAFGAELRLLRRHVDAPLPDLVGEVERVLGLHMEVAARPGCVGSARADVDAFLDAAADFASEEEEPTLRAFLAYLRAAEEEEFGLETGRVGTGESVKVLTVHAAKGLEWPVVAIPGLSAGGSSALFPARPQVSTQWTHNPCLLPFPLRGDAADLPALGGLTKRDGEAFERACAQRQQLEERRLAYVAATRAARVLLCSGFWWGEGTTPLGPSVFLAEVRDLAGPGGTGTGPWCPPPEEGARNPQLAQPASAAWPATPAGPAHAEVLAGAELVRQALARRAGAATDAPPAGALAGDADPVAAAAVVAGATAAADEAGVAARWRRDAAVLLAERAADAQPGALREVALPQAVSVTRLVGLARDPEELARRIRRPVPQPPAPAARRGSAFHAWLEAHYGQLSLIDLEDLPGSEDADGIVDDRLVALQAAFRSSPWWHRTPVEVEVSFETQLGPVLVRGRIDAVFRDPDGGWTVIDWKTGSEPVGAEAAAAAVQLAAYRLAWSALQGVPASRVRAGFHYVLAGVTVQPVDLLDAAGLQALVERLPQPSDPLAGGRRR